MQNQKLRHVFFTVTFEPLDYALPEPINKEMVRAYRLLKTRPKEAAKRFARLYEMYPDHPPILNNLIIAYELDNQSDVAQNLEQILYERFPNYFFGKIKRALNLFEQGKHEEIPALFNNAFNIKDLYPERNVFHFSEVQKFSLVMLKYFCRINDLKRALVQYDIIDELSQHNEDDILKVAKFELSRYYEKNTITKLKDSNFEKISKESLKEE